MKGNINIKSRLDNIDSVHTTTITLCELFKGAYLSHNIERNLALIYSLFDYFNILELDGNAARIYGENILSLKKLEN